MPPKENCPPVRVRGCVRVSSAVGGTIFLGAIVLEPFKLNPPVWHQDDTSEKVIWSFCEFRESVKSNYLVKHFDWHKMTTENYYLLSETSVFFCIRDHGRCIAWKFGISFNRKANACKEKVWNFTENNVVRRNFSKTSRQTVMFRTHILMSCVSNSKYGYIDMKTIYRGEPKDKYRNRVDDL